MRIHIFIRVGDKHSRWNNRWATQDIDLLVAGHRPAESLVCCVVLCVLRCVVRFVVALCVVCCVLCAVCVVLCVMCCVMCCVVWCDGVMVWWCDGVMVCVCCVVLLCCFVVLFCVLCVVCCVWIKKMYQRSWSFHRPCESLLQNDHRPWRCKYLLPD